MEKTGSLFLSLNFESGTIPSRIEILPTGKTIKGRDGREWKNPNPSQVAKNSDARLALKPIDENHSTDLQAPKGGSSPAFGWFKNLSVEKDGSVWADVAWNAAGEDALKNKKYRYISPVFFHNEKGEITAVLRAALTNSPNLELPALNAEEPEKIVTEETLMDKDLCAALGLPETATKAEVLAAVSAQKAQLNAAKPQGGSQRHGSARGPGGKETCRPQRRSAQERS
jgi:phage I-like protein